MSSSRPRGCGLCRSTSQKITISVAFSITVPVTIPFAVPFAIPVAISIMIHLPVPGDGLSLTAGLCRWRLRCGIEFLRDLRLRCCRGRLVGCLKGEAELGGTGSCRRGWRGCVIGIRRGRRRIRWSLPRLLCGRLLLIEMCIIDLKVLGRPEWIRGLTLSFPLVRWHIKRVGRSRCGVLDRFRLPT